MGTLAKIFLPSLDCRTKVLYGIFGKDFLGILGLTNKSSTWELWQRFSCHPWTDKQKLYVGTLAKIFLPSLDWRTKALRWNFGKDFPVILGLTNESSTLELWQRFSCHPWTDEQKLYMGTLAKVFLPSWDCQTKALCGNIGKDFPAILGLTNGKDFPAILGLTNKSSMWELWQRFSCHPWTDEQKLYVEHWQRFSCHPWTVEDFLGKDFPAILGLTNKSSMWELRQRFFCHPWTDERKLYVGTLAKIFLPSLDWRTKALRGNFGKDFPAILGLTNKSSTSWELWQRFSCHPWTDEQKLYVGTLAKIFLPSLEWRMAKIFLPSLDCRTKALCGNFGKDFPAILGLTNKSSTWQLWQRFSCHPWTDEQKLSVGTLAKIFLPSLDWRTKALCGNLGKDFPAILGLTNKSSTWELWQRFSCHPWTDEQKLYVGTLAKNFPAILGLDEQKLYVGTLAKIFLPSLDWRMAKIFMPSLDCGNFGKDFSAILRLSNGKDFPAILRLIEWQRFSCHPWTVEQKTLCGNIGKDFPAILRLSNGKDFPAILGLSNKSSMWEHWQRFSCHPWTDEQKLYVGTLAKISPAILRLTNKSSTWELWQRFSCYPWTVEQKLYVGTLAKIFLPSLDWRTKALHGNFGKDFPAILGLSNKSSTWELWQRFSCHPWTVEQKLYVGTLAKIFLPSLDWLNKSSTCGNFGKEFPAILGLTNKSSTWELWQRFSCHPWTVEQKFYVGNLAKIFLPSLDCRTKALRGNFGKDFPAILGLTNKSSTWELWQRFSCHPWTVKQKLYVRTLAKIFLPSLDWRTKALRGNFGKDFPAILGLTNKKL